jgi:hypothetical protein
MTISQQMCTLKLSQNFFGELFPEIMLAVDGKPGPS